MRGRAPRAAKRRRVGEEEGEEEGVQELGMLRAPSNARMPAASRRLKRGAVFAVREWYLSFRHRSSLLPAYAAYVQGINILNITSQVQLIFFSASLSISRAGFCLASRL